MENRYKINLDFKQKSFTNTNFIQNDVDTSVLEVNVTDGGQAVDITGQVIVFSFLKPDKTIVVQDSISGVTILDGPNGKVECVLRSQTLAAVGKVETEISFTEGAEKKLSSSRFTFNVIESIGDGDPSTNEYPMLDELLSVFTTEGEDWVVK